MPETVDTSVPAGAGLARLRRETAAIQDGRALERPRRHRLRWIVLWSLCALAVGVSSFGAGLLAAPVDLTPPPTPRSALLLDASGRVFATIRSPEVHEQVPASAIPPILRRAIVAAEDERFFEHSGVDPRAVARAAYRDLTGGLQQGGSTITQQYVKNNFVGNERTAMRKLKEAAIAVRLENRLSKDEILTAYLNGLYLGNGLYGVQAASKFYFAVPVQQLTLAQASMLAGIAPAPSLWNPVRDLGAARVRQLYTLNRMVAAGSITPQAASDAYRVPPRIVRREQAPELATDAPEFADMVEARLRRDLDDEQLFLGGTRVRTTLDGQLQRAVREALAEVLPDAEDPQAAVVAIDPRTGDLKALTTKRDGGYQRKGFNLATDTSRSTGSTIKPFTLAAALQAGHELTDVYPGPRSLQLRKKSKAYPDGYLVRNYEGGGGGTYTLRRAMQNSINTVYAKLADEVGVRRVRDLAAAAGLRRANGTPIPDELSIGLGAEVTPVSLAQGYATLAASGVRRDARTVLEVRSGGAGTVADPGSVIRTEPASPRGVRVLSPAVADQVVDVLGDVVAKGTGVAARQSFPVFGKTGTAQDYTNAWFVGCTPELCIATWMGYEKQYLSVDEPHSMRDVHGVRTVTGGTLPAKIFARSLERLREIQAAAANPTRLTPVAPAPSPTKTRRSPRPSASLAPSRPSARVGSPQSPSATPATPATPATRSAVPSTTTAPAATARAPAAEGGPAP